MTTVVITGAGGNIGTKLRRHFEGLGWTLRLLDARAPDGAVQVADLSVWDDGWAGAFRGADAVMHLAADPSPRASWESVVRLNFDLTMNVYEAAARGGAKRLIFASSNWVLRGIGSRNGRSPPMSRRIRLTRTASPSWSASGWGNLTVIGGDCR